jgi:hypothetical protein
MDVRITHRRDEYGPDSPVYEYVLYEFVLGERVVRTRKYNDDPPDEVVIIDVRNDGDVHGDPDPFYEEPGAIKVIQELRRRGFQDIKVSHFGPIGPLDETKLRYAE